MHIGLHIVTVFNTQWQKYLSKRPSFQMKTIWILENNKIEVKVKIKGSYEIMMTAVDPVGAMFTFPFCFYHFCVQSFLPKTSSHVLCLRTFSGPLKPVMPSCEPDKKCQRINTPRSSPQPLIEWQDKHRHSFIPQVHNSEECSTLFPRVPSISELQFPTVGNGLIA